MRQRRWFQATWTALSLLLAGAAMAAPKPVPRPVATVQAASGTLTVRRHSATAVTPLAVRGVLYVGDIVGTGPNSRASLLFRDGSQVRLNANAGVEITAPVSVGKGRKSLFRALSGEVWARIRPGGAAQTRSALIGVRGTAFHLRVEDDGTTTLTVIEGEADFFNDYGAVVVGELQQSVARPGVAPTAPVTIQNAGLIIEWTLELDRAVIPREKFFITPDRQAVDGEVQRRHGRVRLLPNDADARRDLGDALFDGGRYEDALREYEEADRLAPGQAMTLTRLGDTLLELDRLEEAEVRFRAALEADPQHVPALVGVAWLALARDRPMEAQEAAQQAVAADANLGEARVTLGLALLRQPNQVDQARDAFQAALTAEPATYHYQARAWLALVYLAQDDPAAALKEAQAAVQMQPQSALAHGNLALVHFFNGQSLQAEREGRRAVQLNPDLVAARCALGQALLAQGDVDAAARTAAQAVALDPSLPPARYLLGVADAQRRDLSHAARELRECLRLAPDFLPAASALARIYTRMGRKEEAIALLTDLLPRHRNTDQVRAALGAVYYQQAQYQEAEREYREALKLKPNSALYHAELARVLLDANRLNDAITEGQQAVRLAPEVGQYHAVLGLAYDYSRLTVQAEREFREALALDPQNALALLELGLKAAEFDPRENRIFSKTAGLSLDDLLKQGLQAVGSNPAVSSLTQGFLFDPAISDQMLRGGIDTDLTPGLGNESQRNLSTMHRATRAGGAFHSIGLAERAEDEGSRPNDDTTAWHVSENMTFLPDPRTSLLARFSHRRTKQGLPGPESDPELTDRTKDQSTLVQLAVRRRMSRGNSLWVGLNRPTKHLEVLSPDQDTLFFLPTLSGQTAALAWQRQAVRFRSLVPELRLELALNRRPTRPTILTLGTTYARLEPTFTADLVTYPGGSEEAVIAPFVVDLEGRLWLAYAQWTQRVNDCLWFAAQLRQQCLTTRRTTDIWVKEDPSSAGAVPGGGRASSPTLSQSYWLPNLLVNYRADERTLLRLFYNRQAQEQELTTLAFGPVETRLTTEPLTMPQGLPDRTQTVEFDAERYLGSSDFLKLFLFRTSARGVDLGDLPPMKRVVRTGVGLRYERQLSYHLYGQASLLLNRTTNRTPFAPFDGEAAPYHPSTFGGLALNYVDPSGTKLGLQLNYTGSFFQDPGDISAPTRPRFSERMYVDLTLAKEPSVDREFFLKVTNLFDSRAIQFNDFPTGGRRVQAGVTWRF